MYLQLKKERKLQKKNGEYMANIIKKKKAAYSKKERGDVAFTIEETKKISDDLGKPIEYLFST